MNDSGQILFRYVSPDGTQDDAFNPNGSIEAIAGVSNEEGNVVGLMPHPERAAERLLGSEDGLVLFRGVLSWISQAS